jgi:phosphatidylglycerophosphate synthase
MKLVTYIPNFLTIIRFFLGVFIFVAILAENWNWVFIFFLVALLTEIFDGYLARKFGAVSEFGGKYLEAAADRGIIFFSLLGLTIIGRVAPWYTVSFYFLALITYTLPLFSRGKRIFEITLIIRYLGYNFFIIGIGIYVLDQFLNFSTTLVVVFILMIAVAYFKRTRIASAYYGHFKKIFQHGRIK